MNELRFAAEIKKKCLNQLILKSQQTVSVYMILMSPPIGWLFQLVSCNQQLDSAKMVLCVSYRELQFLDRAPVKGSIEDNWKIIVSYF